MYADANIIVRYIINDDVIMAAKAEQAVNSRSIFVLPEVFAEVIYIMRTSFSYYEESKLDFVDCILAA